METARAVNVVLQQLNAAHSCSVNAPEAQCIAAMPQFIFRAGAWKPRTNPNTFQGAGAQALEWLAEVKRTYGMAIATEVATPEHVAAALEAGVDYLWIGARTSANPLAVQAIADAINAALQQLIAARGCSVNAASQQCIAAEPQLNWLRAEIDELDEQLWDTIAARMDVSKRIGEWKKAHGVAPFQPERYQTIVESLKLKAERLGLSPEFAMQIWDMIHEESLKQQ